MSRPNTTHTYCGHHNNRGDNFTEPQDIKNQFSMSRPTHYAGEKYKFPEAESIDDLSVRGGTGNWKINRPNFLSPEINPRMNVEFDRLQLLSLSEAGENLKASNGKLGYTTSIQIPDPTDFLWLRELERLKAVLTTRFTQAGFPANEISAMVDKELQINKPLGREQRTTTSTTNDVANSDRMSTKAKLDTLISDVSNGRAESLQGQQAITAQIVDVLQDTKAINNLTNIQLAGLGQSIARLGVPKNYKQLNLPSRFVDIDFYNANAGIINLLLFSKVNDSKNMSQHNYDLVVLNYTKTQNGLPAMKLSSMVSGLSKQGNKRLFLDLEEGGVISQVQLRQQAGGKDNIANSSEFSINPRYA
jgi:hypothetical protein